MEEPIVVKVDDSRGFDWYIILLQERDYIWVWFEVVESQHCYDPRLYIFRVELGYLIKNVFCSWS